MGSRLAASGDYIAHRLMPALLVLVQVPRARGRVRVRFEPSLPVTLKPARGDELHAKGVAVRVDQGRESLASARKALDQGGHLDE